MSNKSFETFENDVILHDSKDNPRARLGDLARLKLSIQLCEESFPQARGQAKYDQIQKVFERSMMEDFPKMLYGQIVERFKKILQESPADFKKVLAQEPDEFTERVNELLRQNPAMSKEQARIQVFASDPSKFSEQIRGKTERFQRVPELEKSDEAIKSEQKRLSEASGKQIGYTQALHSLARKQAR